jgi:hypothetical protein
MTTLVGTLPEALTPNTTIRGYLLEFQGETRLAFSPEEAGRLLGMSARVVRDLCKAGEIDARIVYAGSKNARYLISARALIEFAEGLPRDARPTTH